LAELKKAQAMQAAKLKSHEENKEKVIEPPPKPTGLR